VSNSTAAHTPGLMAVGDVVESITRMVAVGPYRSLIDVAAA
jgi:hypothetical protein